MQREISFRSYDKEKKLMIQDQDQTWAHHYHDLQLGDWLHKKVWVIGKLMGTLMQFTGLKDNKKIDIYEGDYLGHKYDKLTIFEVFYHDGEGCFRLRPHYINPRCGGMGVALCSPNLFVIGNVWQNNVEDFK